MDNKRSKPVVVRWMEEKQMKHVEIRSKEKKTIDIVIPDISVPESLNLTAFDKEEGKRIPLRGRNFLEVIPRLERTVEKIILCKFGTLIAYI